MSNSQYLLSDEQMRQYITQGYVVLKTSLPASLHETIYQKTEEAFEKEGNPGNNILPRVPELNQVFADPAIVGGLQSVLGPGYLMHAHRHPHINQPHSDGGGWHKDSYWGYSKVRYHRTRWAMIFYYPQDVALENGPTAVMAGTQYYNTRVGNEASEVYVPVVGEAGTAVLVHFDLWHRAMPNSTDLNRYMMKFQFTRMEEPTRPSWNNRSLEWPGNGTDKHRVMWSRIWDWHCGKDCSGGAVNGHSVADLEKALEADEEAERLAAANALGALGPAAAAAVAALARALRDAAEAVQLNAAYALSAVGAAALPALLEALDDAAEGTRLAAAYGLSAVGAAAVPALLEVLDHEQEHVRAYAAYALGEIGAAAGDEAVTALAGMVRDPSEWVRRNVAEALGTVERHAEAAVPALISLLEDEDGQVRFNTPYALARYGAAAASAVPGLARILDDENRYVSGHTMAALQQIGTPEAEQVLFDFLTTSRWCPITTKESMY
jgi:HEAT repeat protein